MRHRQAVEFLSEIGSGSLDPATETALLSHTNSCVDCRDWLRTRDLLAAAFPATPASGGNHVDAGVLALCAARPGEVHEPDHEDIRVHLRHCPRCRHDLALAQAAVSTARPEAGSHGREEAQRPNAPARPEAFRAIAATLVILLLSTGLFAGGLLFERFRPLAGPSDALEDDAATATALRANEQMAVRTLDGTHVIDGQRSLVVSDLTVNTGADVTFRAGGLVAFGDGFRVARGARVRVGSDASGQPDPSRARRPHETREGRSHAPNAEKRKAKPQKQDFNTTGSSEPDKRRD